jgi:uncharacterized protein YndB with AHSA1/START domain
MSGAGEIVDRIEREIVIDATVARVWQLVSEPGWWIGDGDRTDHVLTREGELVIVEDPRYGRFPLKVESTDEPHRITYRWIGEDSSTVVEFSLSDTGGGTLLRVVESGFAAMPGTDEERAKAVEGNTSGWEQQLGIAKRDVERISA